MLYVTSVILSFYTLYYTLFCHSDSMEVQLITCDKHELSKRHSAFKENGGENNEVDLNQCLSHTFKVLY